MPAQTKTDKLITAIKDRIASGEFGPGDKLPSSSELIEQYGISRMTVRIAMERLKAAGVVESIPGSGYYVTGG
ncbi:winged helix-turn-helix domain-containing protein [Micromonospora globbae]|uniref:Winged helix-turn-helix domain-containing protein n=1 Tax=Micromonospora globbae TaxID=1894969 RepID=A0ABZ1RZL1_9ACTN|nr:winged helix-turn-helix domain-containing protein [Micromonospora globbae]